MPIYEFECPSCGHRFERLVAVGASMEPCERCGEEAARILSAQAPPSRLVGTPGTRRRQEAKNAQLRKTTKQRFKGNLARRRAAAARRREGGG